MIKIGVLAPFSGPAAVVGQIYCTPPAPGWPRTSTGAAASAVNGKKMKIALIKGDTMGKPATTKEIADKMCLEEKVDVLWGTGGAATSRPSSRPRPRSTRQLHLNSGSLSDTLLDAKSFTPYTFQHIWTTTSVGRHLWQVLREPQGAQVLHP